MLIAQLAQARKKLGVAAVTPPSPIGLIIHRTGVIIDHRFHCVGDR
ncbi:hypothetical protein ACLB1S_27935 [Escherichia coli]